MKQTNKGRVIDITIPIKPVPKARPRFSSAGHQVFTPSKTHAAENTIAVLVLNKMKLSGMQMIATGPVKVTAEFFFKTAEKRKEELTCVNLMLFQWKSRRRSAVRMR